MDPIDQLITRRVAKILPDKAGLKQLLQQRKIRLYLGIDPTATKLHLGHTVPLRKLQEFAAAGHEAILLFGTGTVLVGDPSLRAEARKPITQAEIDANITTWKDQVAHLIDFDRVTIKQNGDWLLQLTLKDIINIASQISAVQLFKRESFQRRLDAGNTVWYHETMYPLLQGYDSVAMDVDLELGGTDQEFNMLIGRELMRKMKGKEKFVLITPMILGTDGHQMSKTTGNCVWLNDSPEDMFGKLMSIPDDLIQSYFELLTNLASLSDNPLAGKKAVAFDIVRQFHGPTAAQTAQKHFETTIQQGQAPSDIPTFNLSQLSPNTTIVDLLEKSQLVQSRGEAKRLLAQRGVSINQLPITNDQLTNFKSGDILSIGHRKWLKLI
ncbi:MAG: tyrosine--tRNA ligase [Candidatus Chisholmbacteria bacterium RIFCSPHIGHO2_01_FULL_48_12]|uniref:Tyrosine--tRNA ligase n=1 Tax=Candidatus Chisholmbacteria bacterium RIFCSPHIGHO2_01_FULL_48_12 TaxID=1797589 RepID=A0A1G1VJH8_9BACT|nr:MAG: tyrosine--tRNA ligase [Candidatus Chisholmbacteria bacterium RIFCSPHIGHO2_01_FULL_48_12]